MGTESNELPVGVGAASGRTSARDADIDLVAAVRAGDDRAFERLYERYHRRIAAYVYGMVHDYARAEDLAQDVFLSALRRMRATDRPIAFKPWIYEIAKNACIDQYRRTKRAEFVSIDDEAMTAADRGRLSMPGQTPDAEVDRKMTLDHLRGAFSGLSQTHHDILVMRELEGMSYREIGERLGMSRPSVESTLFRARRRLSEEYDELVSGERCRRVRGIIDVAAAGALGARDRRRLGAHVSHCQPCRRQAVMAGLSGAILEREPLRAKVAGLLPIPLFLRRRWFGEGAGGSAGRGHGDAMGSTLGSWGSAASSYAEPVTGWAKAAAVAATVAVAGVGAQEVVGTPDADALRGVPGGLEVPWGGGPRSSQAAPVRGAAGPAPSGGGARTAGATVAAGVPVVVAQQRQAPGATSSSPGRPSGGVASTTSGGTGPGTATTPTGVTGVAVPTGAATGGGTLLEQAGAGLREVLTGSPSQQPVPARPSRPSTDPAKVIGEVTLPDLTTSTVVQKATDPVTSLTDAVEDVTQQVTDDVVGGLLGGK